MTKDDLDKLTYEIIGAAIEVHKELGPGLLESIYHKCLRQELALRRLNFVSEYLVELEYKGMLLGSDLRADFIVENSIVVELKAQEGILPIHEAQVLSYMKMLKMPKGILINFNCTNIFKEGQKTFVSELYKNLLQEK
jgi:GxxExxY protein